MLKRWTTFIVSVFSSLTMMVFGSVFAHQKVVVIPLGGEDAPTFKQIFWTDQTYDGNLGGLPGADAKCQMSAVNAGVRGDFKAWLSHGATTDAIPDRPNFTYYDLPYRNVDGNPVANDFIDFLDNEFEGRIRSVTGSNAFIEYWTGLENDGSKFGTFNCSGWTTNMNIEAGLLGFNDGGQDPALSWSSQSAKGCVLKAHILCFEQ